MEHGAEMESFWVSTELPRKRPLGRLTPRATLRGGFIELYRLKFTMEENPGWTIQFADVNSLYSAISINNEMPIGKYEILLHKDNLKQNITFCDGEFFYKKESMKCDAAHVTLLCPANLQRPYLSYRINDEFNYLALCRLCATNKISKHCPHNSDSSRSFTSSYMVSDLAMAVQLGYKILHWYEVHHYKKTAFILKDFVQILGHQKLKYSDFLSEVTESDRTTFCDKINKQMQFDDNISLRPENVTKNPAQKQLYKDMMNSFFGKFAMHTNFTKHYFCRNMHEIELLASKQNSELVDIFSITENVCEIEVASSKKVTPSQQGCLYITSLINSLARKFIYQKSQQVTNYKNWSCLIFKMLNSPSPWFLVLTPFGNIALENHFYFLKNKQLFFFIIFNYL